MASKCETPIKNMKIQYIFNENTMHRVLNRITLKWKYII